LCQFKLDPPQLAENECANIASFPGHSHLQYLIAYSMQIRRGKAWEFCSRAVTSGRQKVDTRGWCPTVVIFVSPGAMNDGWYWHCLTNALASIPRTDSTTKGFQIPCRALPPVCLPSVYLI